MSVAAPRFGLAGLGASGSEAIRRLLAGEECPIEVVEPSDRRAAALLGDIEEPDRARVHLVDRFSPGVQVVVLASPRGTHVDRAAAAVASGRSVVSLGDDPDEIAELLDLDDAARAAGARIVVGAGLSPGLTCLLAELGAAALDEVTEISVVKTGTGGPACARQHHRALKLPGVEWLDGQWVTRSGGTGRELLWFPGELGARDAYRAALAEPALLHRRFPGARRLSARMTATRRDRLTSRLPMLRPPHTDGGPGGVRVEVRGRAAGEYRTIVYGTMTSPALAAGTVAALVALELTAPDVAPGALTVAEFAVASGSGRRLLSSVHAAGVRIDRFEGSIAAAGRP